MVKEYKKVWKLKKGDIATFDGYMDLQRKIASDYGIVKHDGSVTLIVKIYKK